MLRRTIELMDYLAAHPEANALLRDQQNLRAAVKRIIRSGTSVVPEPLRSRINAIWIEERVERESKPSHGAATPNRVFLGWRLMAVIAASLAIGLLAGRLVLPRPQPQTVVTGKDFESAAKIVPAVVVAHASRIHADCSRLADSLHSAPFPAGQLRDSVIHDLASSNPYPDLTSAGFRFVGAGPCAHPLENTIHLLYRDNHGGVATVSVFVQLYNGQFKMQPGSVYTISESSSPFPMLAWRTEHVIYFLTADDPETVEKARRAIGLSPQQ